MLSGVGLFLGACAGETAPSQGTEAAQGQLSAADELILASAKVGMPPTGLAPGDLPDPNSGGARQVQRYCVACHSIPSPTTHSATDWPRVLRRMWMRIDGLNPSFNVPVPTGPERVAMAQYMVANALRVSGAQLPPGPGRELFSMTCSRCHELADPKQHSPEDWVAVIRRMVDHMQDMLGESLSQEQIGEISNYLRTVSGG